jgi:hypothetical protein
MLLSSKFSAANFSMFIAMPYKDLSQKIAVIGAWEQKCPKN